MRLPWLQENEKCSDLRNLWLFSTSLSMALRKQGVLKKFLYLNGEILMALDGTEHFSSKKINCPHCNIRNHRNGTTTYFHGCVTPVVGICYAYV
jgi:hypothetical protein